MFNLKTKIMGTVVTPLEPTTLKRFLSKSALDKKKIDCLLKAVRDYNSTVNSAARKLENDLKKCLNVHTVPANKPKPKSKPKPKPKTR